MADTPENFGGRQFQTIEEYIDYHIKKAADTLKEEDAKKIVETIMPQIKEIIEEQLQLLVRDIDTLIANKVSEHLRLIGEYMSDKFKPKGE
jgi:hypothetical protein